MRGAALLACGLVCVPAAAAAQDLPRFEVPGHQDDLDALQRLFALHQPRSGPKATLWDAWLPGPALWPATPDSDAMRRAWREGLAGRRLDDSGYVATHQHASIAHPDGWPFPFWNQGAGGFGWHFSFVDTAGPPWRKTTLDAADALAIRGAENLGRGEGGLRLRVTDEVVTLALPLEEVDTLQAPFLQVRCSTAGVPLTCTVRFTDAAGDARARAFPIRAADDVATWVLPLHAAPGWQGTVRDLRLELHGAPPTAELVLRALFSQYDTRHNVNSQAFADGVIRYASWTGDIAFLRAQLPRVRRAIRHVLDDHGVREHGCVRTTWVGHDGRPGFTVRDDGSKSLHPGHGIGNNYWDLLPFGHDDCYATLRLCGTLRRLIEVEERVATHPEWQVPAPEPALRPDRLRALRQRLIATANARFWNDEAGRYVACVDADGVAHDHGFTFVNLEAICAGLAPTTRAVRILDWIDGARTVTGDTSTGADIYRFRFAPRATTRRNVDWYGWYWHAPETIPFGGQVQDGGAVLGFSYHDVMARLQVRGPDDAWRRLRAIAAWYRDVEEAGGYRAYYAPEHGRGTLQGGGTAGGLGIDREFFESVLVPHALLRGFLGVHAGLDALDVTPALPTDWPSFRIDGIRYQHWTLAITATPDAVRLERLAGPAHWPTLCVDGRRREVDTTSANLAIER